ncbi:MAG: type II toxin-antitoxin system VapC family toxin [Steroidobacteraceae bacterium]|jgi:predicted nucleic acid-binding protein|nr:type II toxin-antitoxin system VapC family toxin [Steroidobacteraceae bacterium]
MSATTGSAGLRGRKRVLLDTSLWIYHFESHPMFGAAAGRILGDLEAGRFTAIASELLLLELTVLPLRQGRQDIADQYELLFSHFPNLELVPLSRGILLEASALRAAHGLRTPDAIHIATAVRAGASAIVTNDASWARLPAIPAVTLLQNA